MMLDQLALRIAPSATHLDSRRVRAACTVAIVGFLPLTSLSAQAADTAAVVRVAQTLLRAISTKDTALARTTMIPGATFLAVLDPAPDGGSIEQESDVSFYAQLAGFKSTFVERMWTPHVRFSGTSLAQVSAPYDFHVDGKFSHCGTDVFTLVRAGGGWRIASTTYTVQKQGCAPSPLGSLTP